MGFPVILISTFTVAWMVDRQERVPTRRPWPHKFVAFRKNPKPDRCIEAPYLIPLLEDNRYKENDEHPERFLKYTVASENWRDGFCLKIASDQHTEGPYFSSTVWKSCRISQDL
jgi:hypothetical protein